MKLIDYFSNDKIYRDRSFQDLGYSTSLGKKIITFCDTLSYLQIALKNKNISVIIIKKELLEYIQDTDKGILLSDKPRNSFFKVYSLIRDNNLFPRMFEYSIEKSTNIASTATISKKSYIGHNTVISDNVVIKDNVYIGDNCFIDSGVIIGNEGILYMENERGNNVLIRHAGIVKIGSYVNILANAVVVKSVFQNMPTTIGDHTIIGISTTIGHEASIGKNCRILGNCVIAKNVFIGDSSIVGSSCVIRENITLGNRVDVKAGSIVIKDIESDEVVSGNFAMNHNKNIKNFFISQR